MRTIIYTWEDTKRAGFLKFGDHTIEGEPTAAEIEANTRAYIRGSTSRMKGFFDAGEIVVHDIQDITEYARGVNKNYAGAKIDNHIADHTVLKNHRAHGDFFCIGLDELRSAVNGLVFGVEATQSFVPHRFQQEAIDRARDFYVSSPANTDFLLDCVMRFGKCFTAYHIARELRAQRILILTGRPKVKNGWQRDLDHVAFANWQFLDSQTTDNLKFTTGTEVIFGSFQGSDRPDSRIELALQQDIDLVIIDESHAYFSPRAIDFVRNNIQATRRLWVSGTPFRAYENGMFDGDTDTYRFTLLDLLREKRRVEALITAHEPVLEYEKRFTEFPAIQFLVAEYPVFTDSRLRDSEQGLNMRLLLSADNGVPNYPAEVAGLMDSLSNRGRTAPLSVSGSRGEKIKRWPVRAEHVWMTVPPGRDDSQPVGVVAADVLARAIEQHPIMGARYEPLAIKGDKTETDVNRHITLSRLAGKGTVNISCRSLNTGTRFPEIDTVIFLTETSSAAEFWQTIGRAIQPHPGKHSITVIVYSVEMIVNMANRMVEYSITNQSHTEIMNEFLDMMPIFLTGNEGAQLRPLDIESVYRELSSSGSTTRAFSDREVLSKNFDSLVAADPEFFDTIPRIQQDTAPESVVIMSSDERGRNVKQSRTVITPATPDAVREARERVREFMTCTGSVIAASALCDHHVVRHTADLLTVSENTVDDLITPGTKAVIDHLIHIGALNTAVLDRKIGAFYNIDLLKNITDENN